MDRIYNSIRSLLSRPPPAPATASATPPDQALLLKQALEEIESLILYQAFPLQRLIRSLFDLNLNLHPQNRQLTRQEHQWARQLHTIRDVLGSGSVGNKLFAYLAILHNPRGCFKADGHLHVERTKGVIQYFIKLSKDDGSLLYPHRSEQLKKDTEAFREKFKKTQPQRDADLQTIQLQWLTRQQCQFSLGQEAFYTTLFRGFQGTEFTINQLAQRMLFELIPSEALPPATQINRIVVLASWIRISELLYKLGVGRKLVVANGYVLSEDGGCGRRRVCPDGVFDFDLIHTLQPDLIVVQADQMKILPESLKKVADIHLIPSDQKEAQIILALGERLGIADSEVRALAQTYGPLSPSAVEAAHLA